MGRLYEHRAGFGARLLPDRLWFTGLLGALLATVFVSVLLVRVDGDVSVLVHAAPPFADEAAGTPGSLTVEAESSGFDGQFHYRIGVAPWATEQTVDGLTFDLPALRNARWGYGALAFVVSAGDPDLVPWALVVVNVAAAAVVGAVGGALARTSGRRAAWGLLFLLWPGFVYSLSLDTAELLAAAFMLGGLLAQRRRRWLAAGALLSAAVLTRDTTASVAFGLAATGAWLWWRGRAACSPDSQRSVGRVPMPVGVARESRVTPSPSPQATPASAGDVSNSVAGVTSTVYPPPARARRPSMAQAPVGDRPLGRSAGLLLAGGMPLVVFVSWQFLQRSRFGSFPLTAASDGNLSVPLGGLVDQLGKLLPPDGVEETFRLLSVIGLVALLVAAAWCWRGSAATLAERVAWLPAVAVVMALNAFLWSGATGFMRAATEAGLMSTLLILGSSRRRLPALVALGLAALWALTAVAQASKLAEGP